MKFYCFLAIFVLIIVQFVSLYILSSDINECLESNPCVGGTCNNVPGSFRCDCLDPGTKLDSTGRICLGTVYVKPFLYVRKFEFLWQYNIYFKECCKYSTGVQLVLAEFRFSTVHCYIISSTH